MRVAIVAPHTFPIPPPTFSGEVVIYDLARSLEDLGHDVDLYAPAGSWEPTTGHLYPIACSNGTGDPSSQVSERDAVARYWGVLLEADVVHDWSHTKGVAEAMLQSGHTNVVSTLLGGVWNHPDPPLNIVVWSKAMRSRGLRGATDYEGSPYPDMGGPPGRPITDAHVVYGGTDTEQFAPGKPTANWFLWMNRWHPAKGYDVAIDYAKQVGVELVVAGLHPEATFSPHHAEHARRALELAKDWHDIRVEWLPRENHNVLKTNLYQRARALIYSVQFQEPFGLAQIEAMACGTPVIGWDYGSVPEVVEHGKTGFIVHDLESFRYAVEHVGDIDRNVVRAEAVRRFDRRVMARAYVEQYEQVIAGKVWGAP